MELGNEYLKDLLLRTGFQSLYFLFCLLSSGHRTQGSHPLSLHSITKLHYPSQYFLNTRSSGHYLITLSSCWAQH